MNLVELDIKNIIIFVVGFISFVYGLIVYSQNPKDRSSLFFFFLVLSVTFWSFSMVVFRSVETDSSLWARLLYAAASLIPLFFLFFSFSFPKKEKKVKMPNEVLLVCLSFLMFFASMIPGALIEGINLVEYGENKIIFNSFSYAVYIIYFSIYFILAYFILFKKYFSSKGILREQIRYIMFGTLATVSIGTVTNLLMPFFGLFYLNWLGQISVVFMVISVAYTISKYQLFDVKIILTEALIFSVGVILVMRLFFVKSTSDFIIDIVTIVLVLILGYFLIKSVKNEVKRREHTELLIEKLRVANQKLKELDEAKSDFISIASHQLRTPLTAIKGYTSMIQEGVYGKLDDKVSDIIDKVFHSSQRLVFIVNDLLDMSRIEQGRFKYSPEDINIVDVLKDVIDELKQTALDKGLDFGFLSNDNLNIMVRADLGKIRQVFTNIIDNSIKYTNSGFVHVFIDKDKKKKQIIVKVEDSGMGIDKKSISKIFEKFSRAEEAIKAHTGGSGIGLYVAKEIMKAHKGDVWAESDGLSKGSIFYIKIPLK
jgi:signal transduction histidine kinase